MFNKKIFGMTFLMFLALAVFADEPDGEAPSLSSIQNQIQDLQSSITWTQIILVGFIVLIVMLSELGVFKLLAEKLQLVKSDSCEHTVDDLYRVVKDQHNELDKAVKEVKTGQNQHDDLYRAVKEVKTGQNQHHEDLKTAISQITPIKLEVLQEQLYIYNQNLFETIQQDVSEKLTPISDRISSADSAVVSLPKIGEKIDQFKDQIDQFKEPVSALNQNMQKLIEGNPELANLAIENAVELVKKCQEAGLTAANQIAEFVARSNQTADSLKNTRKRCRFFENGIKHLKISLHHIKTALGEKNQELADAQKAQKELQNQYDELMSEKKNLESSVNQKERNLDAAQKAMETLQTQCDNLMSEKRNLESSVNQKERDLDAAQKTRATLQTQCDNLKSEKKNLEDEKTALENDNTQITGEKQQLAEKLESLCPGAIHADSLSALLVNSSPECSAETLTALAQLYWYAKLFKNTPRNVKTAFIRFDEILYELFIDRQELLQALRQCVKDFINTEVFSDTSYQIWWPMLNSNASEHSDCYNQRNDVGNRICKVCSAVILNDGKVESVASIYTEL